MTKDFYHEIEGVDYHRLSYSMDATTGAYKIYGSVLPSGDRVLITTMYGKKNVLRLIRSSRKYY